MIHPDVKRTLDSFLPQRNENFQTMEIKPGWKASEPNTMEIKPGWKPGVLQTLPHRRDGGGLGMAQQLPDSHWGGGGLNHYPSPKPEGFPPIGRDGGGWKMECKQVPSSGPLGRYPGGRTPDFNPEVGRLPGPWGRPAWPGGGAGNIIH